MKNRNLITLTIFTILSVGFPLYSKDYKKNNICFKITEDNLTDGDSVLMNGTRYRLTSISGPFNAPETRKSSNMRGYYVSDNEIKWGFISYNRAKYLVGNRAILCEDGNLDIYKRKIATVELSDGSDIGELLLKEGLAYSGKRREHIYWAQKPLPREEF